MDSSPGGLRLTLLDETIVEGNLLYVKAATAGAAAAWTRVQVRNRLRKNGWWELGCQCVCLPHAAAISPSVTCYSLCPGASGLASPARHLAVRAP